MRTDGEIKRLSEMPADSIAAATTAKIGPRQSRWQLCGKATSLSQTLGRGHGRSWHECDVQPCPRTSPNRERADLAKMTLSRHGPPKFAVMHNTLASNVI